MGISPPQESPVSSPRSLGWVGILVAGLVVAVVYLWFVTHGTWHLFAAENFGQFYDFQALSFVHGRLDVPPKAVEFEAFMVDGRSYGYWGPFPALLRLPLAVWGEGPWVGHTARFSCLLAALITFGATLGIFVEVARCFSRPITRKFFSLFFLAAFAVGSPTLFLLSHGFIYHEVILWAGALALVGFWLLLRFINSAKLPDLYWAIGCGIASALTRPTFGYGLLLSCALLALRHGWILRKALPRPPCFIVPVLIFFGLASPLAYNFVRFHAIDPPYKNHALYDAARLAKTGGGVMFQPRNLPGILSTYLSFRHVGINAQFPYFRLKHADTTGLVIDGWEPHAGLGATMTGALIVAAVGLVYGLLLRPVFGSLLTGAMAGIVLTCSFPGIQERYLQDFLPFFVLTVTCGVLAIGAWSGKSAGLFRGVLMFLLLLSIFQYGSLSLVYQRASPFTTSPEDKAAFEKFGREIDHALRRTYTRAAGLPLPLITVERWDDLPPPRPGLVVKKDAPFGVLWHDGLQWVLLAGDCEDILHLQLEVIHPAANPGTINEPLVVTGPKDRPNILFLQSFPGNEYGVGCEIWGIEMKSGPIFKCPTGVLQLEVVVDRVNSMIRVVYEKQIVFETRTKPFPVEKSGLLIGLNPLGGSYATPTCLPTTSIKVLSKN